MSVKMGATVCIRLQLNNDIGAQRHEHKSAKPSLKRIEISSKTYSERAICSTSDETYRKYFLTMKCDRCQSS